VSWPLEVCLVRQKTRRHVEFCGLLDSFMFFCCKNFIELLNIVCGTGGFWNQQKGSLRAHVCRVQVKQELLKWNRIIAYTNYFRSVSSLQSPPRLLSLGLPYITWPSIWTCQMYTLYELYPAPPQPVIQFEGRWEGRTGTTLQGIMSCENSFK